MSASSIQFTFLILIAVDRSDVGGLRGGPRTQDRGSAWTGLPRSLSAATIPPGLHRQGDGKQRPLSIAALEDKIVQGATVMVLNAIYQGDFVGFSALVLWGGDR